MERLIEFIIAIPIVGYPILFAVGIRRGKVRLYKCTVDAKHDLRMRAALPEMDVQRRAVPPRLAPAFVDRVGRA